MEAPHWMGWNGAADRPVRGGMHMANNNPTKVVTGPDIKMSYLHILEPAFIN